MSSSEYPILTTDTLLYDWESASIAFADGLMFSPPDVLVDREYIRGMVSIPPGRRTQVVLNYWGGTTNFAEYLQSEFFTFQLGRITDPSSKASVPYPSFMRSPQVYHIGKSSVREGLHRDSV